jgi:hypothetical protein
MNKAEELMKGEDLQTAFGVLIDMYQYDAIRERYEGTLLSGLSYCLTFLHKDYARAKEMVSMVTEDHKKGMNEFYSGLLEKTLKELEDKKDVVTTSSDAN